MIPQQRRIIMEETNLYAMLSSFFFAIVIVLIMTAYIETRPVEKSGVQYVGAKELSRMLTKGCNE